MKSNSDTRKPYTGTTRKLVLALDIGTTFSGVSYAVLEPGDVPKIHGVTRFPGQEHVAGNCKIPTIMYYDRHGKVVAAGAEAETPSILSQAEENGWTKTELFKLRLRPRTMEIDMNGMRLGSIPHGKSAVHVFGDFLRYLFACTRNFIIDTHANGAALWSAVEQDIHFVLSHPNGWEGRQQAKLRRSAVYGGLVPDTDEGKARIFFVTEGEASLHACVLSGLAADVLSNRSKPGFLVADLGGGTVDLSAYTIRRQKPLVIEEIAPPDCIFAGSVFVSRRARTFLAEKLKNSKYGSPDALDHITKRFDETTKRLFRDKNELQFIHFGSPLDKDPSVGVRGGQLKLTGQEASELFEPSIEAIVKAVEAQIAASASAIKSVWLVGGFAANPWLFVQLQERLAPITVSRPDTQTSKAVADGAIGFYCDHHVSARVSKFMYGVEYLRTFDAEDETHVARRERLCELPSGPTLLPDAFDCILSRNVKVEESTVFTRKYFTELTSLSILSTFEVQIWCYRGPGTTVPKWIQRESKEFSTLCVVRADLSALTGSAEAKTGKNGKVYWTIIFSVEIHFGLTEFKSRIKWIENGETRYGPASIVYNEHGRRIEEDDLDSHPDDMSIGSNSRAESVSGRSSSTKKSGSAFPTFSHIPDVIREPEHTQAAPQSPTKSTTLSPKRSREDLPPVENVEDGASVKLRGRTKEKGKGKEKGKEREKEKERPSKSASRARTRSSVKLAEALTSVWGAVASPISPSRSLRGEQVRSPGIPSRKDLTLVADMGGAGDVSLTDITNVPETQNIVDKTPIQPETDPEPPITGPTDPSRKDLTLVPDMGGAGDVLLTDITDMTDTQNTVEETPIPPKTESEPSITDRPPAVTERLPEDIPLPATPAINPKSAIATHPPTSRDAASPRDAPSRKSLSPRPALSAMSGSPRLTSSASPHPAVSPQFQSPFLNSQVALADDLNFAASIQLPASGMASPISLGGANLDDFLENNSTPMIYANAGQARGDDVQTTAGTAGSALWSGFDKGWPLIAWKAAS